MTNDRLPTTDEIRSDYAKSATFDADRGFASAEEQFDAWLAEHNRRQLDAATTLIRAEVANEILETPRFKLEDAQAEAALALGIKHAALIAHGWLYDDELRGAKGE